jgi:multidrug efflux pump subunit AcrA (membrane-fusion protein)
MSTVQVKAGFAEVDAVKLSVGQPVTVSVSAQPGTQLTGKVDEIDPSATVVSNVVTYNALISVANPPPTLKPGMTASVSVQVATRPNVLEVPTAAIQTRGGTSVVSVDQGGKAVPTTVTTGLQGDTTTEITSGLKAGQQLRVTTGTVTSGSPTTGARPATGGGTGGLGGGGGVGGGGVGGGGTRVGN